MPLDYSKWDKLELSDDSDIEVHPNVDKRSMIRWKQQAIHQERAERRAKMDELETVIPQQKRTIDQLQGLITTLEEQGVQAVLTSIREQQTKAREQGMATQQAKDGISLDQVFGAMIQQIETGLTQSDEATIKASLLDRLQQTLSTTQTMNKAAQAELDRLTNEANKKLTSENLFHETSNRTILNTASHSKPEKKTAKQKQTVVETLNPHAQMKDLTLKDQETQDIIEGDGEEADDEDDEELEDLTPTEMAFSKLEGFSPSYKFLQKHSELVSSKVHDQVMAAAFMAQLRGEDKYAKNCVVQALTLQYCGQLHSSRRNGVDLFFERMMGSNEQARRMFSDDVATTYEHLRNRCLAINEEQSGRATIQLQPVKEGSNDLTVRIPNTDDPELLNSEQGRHLLEVYESLPAGFRAALETAQLDKVNAALEDMNEDDGEYIVKVCAEYGFLDLSGDVIDETGREA
ncbi:Hsp90 co-chaperone CDC37 [Hesseltinella vesiculosa]|uniref:Hsp90 chaperone protein kinase-targeting subunit n=1 Tax=Hesseltinella vesiculosa TaxID=101127 RepID=A0A1X2G609_9FUNG|nr:Hsp90 co-chaperone CDC37 [Hesseltinella vesiculosa]